MQDYPYRGGRFIPFWQCHTKQRGSGIELRDNVQRDSI